MRFRQVVELIAPQDVMVLNDTRVIKARLTGRKKTGGKVEVLIERVLAHDEALAQMRVSHPPREGSTIILAESVEATVLERRGGFFRLRFADCDDVFALLERHGAVPLPPYIEHAPDADDEARYQTVYARQPGAVAAPTAGLHFDEALLQRLRERGRRSHTSRCTWAPALFSRCARATWPGTKCTASGTMCRERRWTRYRRREKPAAASSRSGRPHCGRWKRPVRRSFARESERRSSSSCPAIGFAWSTGSSPISICRDRRCSCFRTGFAHATSTVSIVMGMPC